MDFSHDEHDEQLASKKRKAVGRTRAACEACRSCKQKCDAQTSYPCRRCQLYGLECRLDAETVNGPNITRSILSSPPPAGASPSNPSMGDKLQDIVDRLNRIEFAVMQPQWSHQPTFSSPPTTIPLPPAAATSPVSQHSSGFTGGSGPVRPPVEATSEQVDDGALQQVRNLTATYNVLPDEREGPLLAAPDAIKRGILTEDVARELFEFYFANLEGSTLPIVSQEIDGNADAVRRRSPLLFNSILLTSAYYTFLGSDQGRAAYECLANLEAELLGPTILFARMNNHHLSLSSIRALMLVTARKPLLHANVAGSAVPLAEQFTSKLDLTAAALPMQLSIRMAYLMDLRKQCMEILSDRSSKPTPDDMEKVRVWFSLCMMEAQGALQAGRLAATNAVDHDSMLDRFHEVGTIQDTWQAAYLALTRTGRDARWALFEQSRQAEGCGHHRNDIDHLRHYLVDYDQWRARWVARSHQNKIHYLVSRFVHLVLLSKYVALWAKEYRANGEMQPYSKFNSEQRDILQRAVRTASEALYGLSVESRAPETVDGRELRWTSAGEIADNRHPMAEVEPLTPDTDMVQTLARSIDTMTCVVVPFLALFLASHAGQTCTCNLTIITPQISDAWKEPVYMRPKGKMRRLLDLTADTLELSAPNLTHPAVGHARMLRSLIDKKMRAKAPEGMVSGDEFAGMQAMPSTNSPASAPAPSDLNDPSLVGPYLSTALFAVPGVEPSLSGPLDYTSLFGVDINLGTPDIDWSSLVSMTPTASA